MHELPAEQRLKSQRLFEVLFKAPRSIKEGKVKCLYRWVEEIEQPVQVAFAAPKKSFKRAVDRNRIKRQMRAIFREESTALKQMAQPTGKNLLLLLIYTGSDLPDHQDLRDKIILSLQRLQQEIT